MSATLSIAKRAEPLPAEAATRTFGVFGQRGTGKTTTARVLAEEMCRNGGHVVVLDPVGAWWGVTRDGTGKGIPGIVLGGEHGDVPLEETGGALVADLVVDRHWPIVVVDMKLLRKGAQRRFMADFLEGVFHSNRRPLHLVFEEADRAFPQKPQGMDPTLGRVIGAGEDIVKLGRSRGLGTTIVSQRFASVTKNVTEQTETLVLHRFIGPKDRKAAQEWIESNGEPEVTKTVLDSLAQLKVGEAWLYSPGWLGRLDRVQMRAAKTFDSSATPDDEMSVEEEEALTRARVDLDELRDRMAETVERAKANDPAELRRQLTAAQQRVVELTEELENRPAEQLVVPDRELTEELAQAAAGLEALHGEFATEVREAREAVRQIDEQIAEAVKPIEEATRRVDAVLDRVGALRPEGETTAPAPEPPISRAAEGRAIAPHTPSLPASSPPPAANGNASVKAGARRMLAVLKRYGRPLSRRQLGTLADVAMGGTMSEYVRSLVDGGYAIEDDRGVVLTQAGDEQAGPQDARPFTAQQILAMHGPKLKAGAVRIAELLIANPGQGFPRTVLSERCDVAMGGTMSEYVRSLVKRGLAEERNREVYASETLFLESLAGRR